MAQNLYHSLGDSVYQLLFAYQYERKQRPVTNDDQEDNCQTFLSKLAYQLIFNRYVPADASVPQADVVNEDSDEDVEVRY